MLQTLVKNILLSLFLLFFLAPLYSSDRNSFIINYDKKLYENGQQTWQIANYDRDWSYFANNNGLLQFNCNSWEIFPLNNASYCRSVLPLVSEKRIYLGGINEFGYLEPGDNGILEYSCISDSLDVKYSAIGNVWNIHNIDNVIYFQGDNSILKYNNGECTRIEAIDQISCSAVIGGVLYIGSESGVSVLVGNKFLPIQDGKILNSKKIVGITPYKEGILITTSVDGLYYYNGFKVVKKHTGYESFMRINEVLSVAYCNSKIALGTVKKGVVIINLNDNSSEFYSEDNGLRNNTVLSLSFDLPGNLWVGLDNGIDYICVNSMLSNLYTFPHSYGSGYASILDNNKIYFGTNRGLYYSDFPIKFNEGLLTINEVPESSGQIWNLNRVGDDLFCLHDKGLYFIDNGRMKQINGISGAWKCEAVIGKNDMMYVGVYNGLYLVEKRDGEWNIVKKIEGIYTSARIFEQESERVIWISTVNKTVRIELSRDYSKVINAKQYSIEQGFPNKNYNYVNKIKDKIVFNTYDGIFFYNSDKDILEPIESLNKRYDNLDLKKVLSFKQIGDKVISLSSDELSILDLSVDTLFNEHTISTSTTSIEYIPESEALFSLSDSLIIIPNNNGFALLDLSLLETSNNFPNDRVSITKVYNSYWRDSLIYSHNFNNNKIIPEIEFKNNSIRIEWSTSSIVKEDKCRYKYRLDNRAWSQASNIKAKEYTNLSSGEHKFEVKLISSNGLEFIDSFNFYILPPWYLDTAALIVYIVIIMLFVYALYSFDNVRLKRKQQKIIKEKDKELKDKQQEYERENHKKEKLIIALEKSKLEYELKHKSQEVVNLMINFMRKNDILGEIKSDLLQISSTLKGDSSKEGKKMLNDLNNKISFNIQDDDILKRIEEQFDYLHNDFMKKLSDKYPNLSVTERMMCAYLKMNLSSKEIAPLLNISIRGVETIRYRLRKKFQIERDCTINSFLDSIK